jgi:hypothetical protein
MALVLEDGTGLVNANSYTSLSAANDYLTLRGRPVVEEVHLIQATDYIDTRWGDQFVGEPLKDTQALAFPRTQVTGIPKQLKIAAAEYASFVQSGGVLLGVVESGNIPVSEKSEKVGPITETTKYAVEAQQSSGLVASTVYPVIPAADPHIERLLRGFVSRVLR